MAEGNGHYKDFKEVISELSDKQDSIENVLIKGFSQLNMTINEGHHEIADEIKKIREVGSLPLPLAEKLFDHINGMNNKNSDKIYKLIIIITVAILGIKEFFPHVLGG